MKQQLSVVLAAALFAATPALAADPAPASLSTTPFNCDFEPSCEVSPGVYGALQSPTTSKFNLAIGGFLKLDYAYNTQNFGPTGFLIPSGGIANNNAANAKKSQSIFSVRSSRLWFKAGGPSLLGAKTTGLLEFDFHNTNNNTTSGENLAATPRLRQAYANLDWGTTQLLFGQSGEAFTGGYSANTVDLTGGTGGSGTRHAQVKLTQRVNLDKNNSLKLTFGVEQASQSNYLDTGNKGSAGNASTLNTTSTATLGSSTATAIGNGTTSTAGDSWGTVPNVIASVGLISKVLGVSPGYLGQSLNNLTVNLYSLYGSQHVKGEPHTIDSWGAGIYTFIPVLNSKDGKSRAQTLTFEADAFKAANLPYGPTTATSYVGTSGNLKPARGFGLRSQALYFPTQDISIATGYGRRQAFNYGDYQYNKDFQKYYQSIYANVSYDLNAAVRVAAEFNNLGIGFGNVSAGKADSGHANVYRFAFSYFF